MQDNKIIFESREKILDTIKISNKSKEKLNESIRILEEVEIPSDFECLNRIKESINLLGNIIHNIDKTNERLYSKVEEFCALQKRYRRPKFNITNIGAYGMSYEELNNMETDELFRVLGNKVLEAPVLQYLTNPLDKENSEIPRKLKNRNMFNYIYRIENRYTKSTSVCEGATYLDENTIAYCDVNTHTGKGYLRIMRKGEKYKKTKQLNARTATEVFCIEIEGHSNDITYIPENGVLLHIDDKTNAINVFKLDKDYNITKTKTIDNIKANGIAYDKKCKEVIILNGRNVERYSKNNLINKKTKPEPEKKCIIPNKIKDEDNSTYYNYIQGIAAYDGLLYVSYSGFKTDKEKYSWDNGEEDRPIGNRIVIYDYENGGEAIGSIIDNVGIEIESLEFNKKENLTAFYNGGHYTRVFETDLVNAKTIAKDYKASKNENNYIEVAKNESNHKDKSYNQKNS